MFLFMERKTISPFFPAKHVPYRQVAIRAEDCSSDLRSTAGLCGGTASIGAAGRAKFESTELCSVYVDLHAIPALAIGNGS